MNVLQICSELYYSKVHALLFKHLDEAGIKQTIYCFFEGKNKNGKNMMPGVNMRYIYADIIKPIHHYLYHIKAHVAFKYLKGQVDFNDFDCVHAATLFTNGIHAYHIYKKYGIPYLVAVRNTDIVFFKKAPHTWKDGRNILLNAQKIIFIAPWIRHELEGLPAVKPILEKIKDKFIIQPNGIDDFWLNSINTKANKSINKIIYVGSFVKWKQLDVLISCIERIRKYEGLENIRLCVVGGGKDTDGKISELVKSKSQFVDYFGRINDIEKVREMYRNNSIFAMPSIHETMGLVYIEALSQNLAILYSKNDGVDGLLDPNAGIGVDPYDENSIEHGLLQLLVHRDHYSNHTTDFTKYDWARIAQRYSQIYSDI